MKKIMFNDKYGLTNAVLNGTKTMTRRILDSKKLLKLIRKREGWSEDVVLQFRDDNALRYALKYASYKVGDIVAIAQPYKDILDNHYVIEQCLVNGENPEGKKYDAGFSNKMFVSSRYMPHHIKITDLRVERLQEITEEECLKEGIKCHVSGNENFMPNLYNYEGCEPSENWSTAREAFAALIDKVGKKGTWKSNPWVYAYTFELVD